MADPIGSQVPIRPVSADPWGTPKGLAFVRIGRFELPREISRQILSLVRLPFRHIRPDYGAGLASYHTHPAPVSGRTPPYTYPRVSDLSRVLGREGPLRPPHPTPIFRSRVAKIEPPRTV